MDVERPEGDIREASDANEAHHVNEGKDEMTANARPSLECSRRS
jgi:hypothetical protein